MCGHCVEQRSQIGKSVYHVSPRLQVSDGQGTSSGRGTVLCGGQGPSAVPETELTQVCACAQPQAVSRELVHLVHVTVSDARIQERKMCEGRGQQGARRDLEPEPEPSVGHGGDTTEAWLGWRAKVNGWTSKDVQEIKSTRRG